MRRHHAFKTGGATGPRIEKLEDEFSKARLTCADLHPGNILVALDPPPGPLLSSAAYMVDRFKPFGWKVPSSWREPAIVLLDVGECSDLNSYASCYSC